MKVYYSVYEVVKDERASDFEQRCKAQFAKLEIAPTEERHSLFGTRTLDYETRRNYLSKVRAFVTFLLDNGNFDDSLLPFHPKCPRGVIAVSAKAVSLFMIVIYAPKGAPVVDQHGEPIQNAGGAQFTGKEQWHNCENMNQFGAALAHIHINSHQMAPNYTERCDACVDKFKQRGFGGCMHHPIPRYMRTGNVATTTLFRDTVSFIKSRSSHIVQGACHLLPSDVRILRRWVTANNNVFGFEVFTLLLMSIELFLRKAEYSSLSGDNFNEGLFLLSDKYVPEALNLSVKGKRTNRKEKKGKADVFAHWRKLWIFGDDTCPDVCLKRHLLAFLYCIEWKGGMLFPSRDELENPPKDGIYKTCIGEEDLMATLKVMFTDVLKREDKLASHTGRKTGYLWGRIRGGSVEVCMQGADHVLFDTAKKYFKDAEATADLIKRASSVEEKLGEFHSCYCAPNTETSSRVTRRHAKYQCPLVELVYGFIEVRVGINRNNPQSRHPAYIMDKLLQWKKPGSPLQELKGHLKDVSSDKTDLIMGCVESLQGYALQRATADFNKKVEGAAKEESRKQMLGFQGYLLQRESNQQDGGADEKFSTAEIATLFEEYLSKKNHYEAKRKAEHDPFDDLNKSKKKKEARGEKELEKRSDFAKMKNAKEKFDFLEAIYDPNHGNYRNSDRQWLLRVKKTLHCYENCCNKDPNAYILRHGSGTTSPSSSFRLGDIRKCETCCAFFG